MMQLIRQSFVESGCIRQFGFTIQICCYACLRPASNMVCVIRPQSNSETQWNLFPLILSTANSILESIQGQKQGQCPSKVKPAKQVFFNRVYRVCFTETVLEHSCSGI